MVNEVNLGFRMILAPGILSSNNDYILYEA